MTRPDKRPVNGILVLDKPAGYSSNQALQKVRRLFAAAKGGHTGSLDPLATGVLPLCLGEATKFSRFLLDADKAYHATVILGRDSTTGDSEGELLTDSGVPTGLNASTVEKALARFRGDIEQVPPMYSALKHQGQPLYKLARAGVEVERAPRKVQIHRLEMVDCRPRHDSGRQYLELELAVDCSKGTYIRSLAADLGRQLGCGGLVTALRRTRAGIFTEQQAIPLSQLEAERGDALPTVLDHHLLPASQLTGCLKQVSLPEPAASYFRQGQAVRESAAVKGIAAGELVSVSLQGGEFLGVAEVLPDGRVAPRRLVTG